MKELWGKDFCFLLDVKRILLLLKTFSIKSKINKNKEKALEIMLKVTKILPSQSPLKNIRMFFMVS